MQETKLRRDAKAVDTHIHACLYFLDTTSKTNLSDVDRYMLRVLSSRVNIIPVVGKADTLTAVQRETIRKAYRWNFFDIFHIPVYGYIEIEKEDDLEQEQQQEQEEQASNASGEEEEEEGEGSQEEIHQEKKQAVATNHSGSEIMDTIMSMLKEYVEEDNDEDARAMYEYLEHFPLTLVGYEEDPETGRPVAIMRDSLKPQKQADTEEDQQPSSPQAHTQSRKKGRSTKTVLGRKYPWAVVECSNPDHCDFERLKSMILSVHRDMFRIDTFERFYEKYRTKQLMNRRFEGSPTINKGKLTNPSATTTHTKVHA